MTNKQLLWIKIVIICVLPYFSFSQNTVEKLGSPTEPNIIYSNSKISPYTSFLLTDLKSKNQSDSFISDTSIVNKFSLHYINGKHYVNSFLLIDTLTFNESETEILGVKIQTSNSNILTALLPVNAIEAISKIQSIRYIQIGEPVSPRVSNVQSLTWTDWVHQGYLLPQSYKGDGVVVGVVDGGFDYRHPNFFDATGSSNFRIKRVWEQNATTGTPPSGFNYGRELVTQSTIINAQRDVNNSSHGTHVAGIAAGAGGNNSSRVGVAPNADLALVSTSMTNQGIAEGLAYIKNYSFSIGKPSVANVSIGSHIGPHDGTSMFDLYCNNLTDNGFLIVGSAGNEGDEPIHITKTLTSSDNSLFSFLVFPNSSRQTNGASIIDIWGNPNVNFSVAVNVYNTNNNSFESYTPYISTSTTTSQTFSLPDNDPFFTDYCYVQIATETNQLNNKKRAQIAIDNTEQDDNYRWAVIEIIGSGTQVKLWAGPLGGEAFFSSLGKSSPWISGTTASTVGEIGGTAHNIISVGSYNSTATTVGAISGFSSRGPTADGRTKPDITAPGNQVFSSGNIFDNTNGNVSWYSNQGTSMAAPVVTGVLALWLQAYPFLNPSQARQLLKDNAWKDSFTGNIPTSGSNTWGWGKVDAHEGLYDLVNNKIPAQPQVNIVGSDSICQGQSVTLTAPSGFTKYLWSNNATTQSITVNSPGTYSVRVENNQGYISKWSLPKQIFTRPNPTTPTITVSQGNTICNGQPKTLTVLNTCQGCSYQWSLNNQTGTSIQTNISGSYTVVASNQCGSVSSSQVNLVSDSTPLVPVILSSPSDTICTGQSVLLSIGNTCSSCSYTWQPSNTSGATLSVTNANTYTATSTNQCGTSVSQPKLIVAKAAPQSAIINSSLQTNILCSGQTATLSITNPCNGCSYQWLPINIQGTSVQVSNAGNYSVIASNSCGNASPASITLSNPNVTISAASTNLCEGQSATFQLNSNTQPTLYDLYSNNQLVNSSSANSFTISPAATSNSGSYYVNATTTCGSVQSNTIQLNVYPKPIAQIQAGATAVCSGKPLTLSTTHAGGVLWQPGSFTSQTITVYPTQNTEYKLQASTTYPGVTCTSRDSIFISILPNPIVNLGNDTGFCAGSSVTINAGNFNTFQWSNGITGQENQIFIAGNYTITVTDNNNCSATDNINIASYPLPQINLGADTTICSGQMLVLDANGAFTNVKWSDNSVGSAFVVTQTGSYAVTVTNSNNCTNTDNINVSVEVCSGISNINSATELKLYPNPTFDKVFIEFPTEQNQVQNINVFSTNGGLIIAETHHLKNQKIIQLDVSKLAAGAYFIQVFNNNSKWLEKLFVKD